jgi:hypothetical protein
MGFSLRVGADTQQNIGDSMGGPRKRFNAWLLTSALLFAVSPASAMEPKDVSYFCVAEATGGLSFNTLQKKWIGTSFRPTEKFVLRLKFVDVRVGTTKLDKDEYYANFEATLTESGSNSQSRCTQLGAVDKTAVSIGKYNNFSCYANVQEYVFNLDNNRYLSVYASGYTDGVENNDNTPGVTGGVCTKID